MSLPGVRSPTLPPVSCSFLKPATGLTRVEDRIRHAKNIGLGRLPSREFAPNQAWLVTVELAADLMAWTPMLARTGDAAGLALFCVSPRRSPADLTSPL